jgi:hypothetical protein
MSKYSYVLRQAVFMGENLNIVVIFKFLVPLSVLCTSCHIVPTSATHIVTETLARINEYICHLQIGF